MNDQLDDQRLVMQLLGETAVEPPADDAFVDGVRRRVAYQRTTATIARMATWGVACAALATLLPVVTPLAGWIASAPDVLETMLLTFPTAEFTVATVAGSLVLVHVATE